MLRSALDADAQLELLERVGSLAAVGFSDWPTRASSQDHPMIITSHSSNATRSRECRRACGLAKCMGHCGRHVGALVERPEDMYGLANDVAAKIARDLGETGFAMDFFSSEPADDGTRASATTAKNAERRTPPGRVLSRRRTSGDWSTAAATSRVVRKRKRIPRNVFAASAPFRDPPPRNDEKKPTRTTYSDRPCLSSANPPYKPLASLSAAKA